MSEHQTRPLPAPLVAAERLVRWLSLTLIHQGTWPLLILLLGAPLGGPAATPWLWFPLRLLGPTLAAALAAGLLAQGARVDPPSPHPRSHPHAVAPAEDAARTSRAQVRLALFGLAAALAMGRFAIGPVEGVGRLLLFGAADVAAFQVIHFGVVARSFAASDQGQAAAVLLFGVSWGLRETALAALEGGGLVLAFGGGLAVGLAVGLLSRGLRRWPGGAFTAAVGHWLVVYLILGFLG